jgi:cell division protein FtsB
MTEPDTRTERTARIVIAVLGVMAAFLGTLTAYFAATKSDVVQQRNDVRSDVSTLTTQQSNLKDQVTRLTRENADLRGKLAAAPTDSASPDDASKDGTTRPIVVTLADDGSSIGVFLDQGNAGTGCCADFYYGQRKFGGRPQFKPGNSEFSTAVDSAQISREDCARAATERPIHKPISPPRFGLICALSDGGVSLLQLHPPDIDGGLKISQKYWPNP